MHELGIVFHIIRTVEDVAKQNDVTRIRRVTLQLGEVSGVVESYLGLLEVGCCQNGPAARRGADGGDHPGRHPMPSLRPAVRDRALRPNLPPLRKPGYLPGAGQRDDDKRN